MIVEKLGEREEMRFLKEIVQERNMKSEPKRKTKELKRSFDKVYILILKDLTMI